MPRHSLFLVVLAALTAGCLDRTPGSLGDGLEQPATIDVCGRALVVPQLAPIASEVLTWRLTACGDLAFTTRAADDTVHLVDTAHVDAGAVNLDGGWLSLLEPVGESRWVAIGMAESDLGFGRILFVDAGDATASAVDVPHSEYGPMMSVVENDATPIVLVHGSGSPTELHRVDLGTRSSAILVDDLDGASVGGPRGRWGGPSGPAVGVDVSGQVLRIPAAGDIESLFSIPTGIDADSTTKRTHTLRLSWEGRWLSYSVREERTDCDICPPADYATELFDFAADTVTKVGSVAADGTLLYQQQGRLPFAFGAYPGYVTLDAAGVSHSWSDGSVQGWMPDGRLVVSVAATDGRSYYAAEPGADPQTGTLITTTDSVSMSGTGDHGFLISHSDDPNCVSGLVDEACQDAPWRVVRLRPDATTPTIVATGLGHVRYHGVADTVLLLGRMTLGAAPGDPPTAEAILVDAGTDTVIWRTPLADERMYAQLLEASGNRVVVKLAVEGVGTTQLWVVDTASGAATMVAESERDMGVAVDKAGVTMAYATTEDGLARTLHAGLIPTP